jgi:AcrR family transcriptional regulator
MKASGSSQHERINRAEFKLLCLKELYPNLDPRQLRIKLAILEAAIRCFAIHRVGTVNLTRIASEGGTTVKTIRKYFGNISELKNASAAFVRKLMQKFVAGPIAADVVGPEAFDQYYLNCFKWLHQYPEHFNFWLYLFRATRNETDLRRLNSSLVSIGTERISGFLRGYPPTRNLTAKVQKERARAAQLLLTGAMISQATEDLRSVETCEIARRFCNSILFSY